MRLVEINYCVMPDLIRHPEYSDPSFLDSGFRRNDKSLRDNGNFSSPKGEGFRTSPKGTLIGRKTLFFNRAEHLLPS